MRYFISFIDVAGNKPYGSGVVDAESEEEALEKVRAIGTFPSNVSEDVEALVFTLDDDDQQGKDMLGKFLDFKTMQERYGRQSITDGVPDDKLSDFATEFKEYLEESDLFLGSRDLQGRNKPCGVLTVLESLIAKTKGQVH